MRREDDRTPSRDERIWLTDQPATLDGQPAKITGYNHPYASVRSATTSATFAWATVAHIVTTRQAAFHS